MKKVLLEKGSKRVEFPPLTAEHMKVHGWSAVTDKASEPAPTVTPTTAAEKPATSDKPATTGDKQ